MSDFRVFLRLSDGPNGEQFRMGLIVYAYKKVFAFLVVLIV